MKSLHLGALNSCPFPIALLNSQYEIQRYNTAFQQAMPSCTAKSLPNAVIHSLFNTVSAQKLRKLYFDVTNGQSHAYQSGLKLSNKRQWFDAHINKHPTIKDHYLLYLKDVSVEYKTKILIDSLSLNMALMLDDNFHVNVCQFLSEKLDYEFVLTGKLIEGKKVQILGAFGDGEALTPFEYKLEGTPCAKALGLSSCVYPADVQQLFPNDSMLKDMNVVSYIGASLFDANGNKIGLLAALSRQPILHVELAQQTLEVFAERISSEMDRQRAHELLSYQALYDDLCRIPNRRAFQRSLEEALILAKTGNNTHALLYLDLDQFKVVNDSCGHAAGDELLKQVSALLQTQIGRQDTIARLGGDEFAILYHNCNLEEAITKAEGCLTTVNQFQFVWDNLLTRPALSIGITPINSQSENINQLLKQADTACYIAKDKGRNCFHIYENNLDTHQHEQQLHLITAVHKSLKEDRFTLFAQAIKPSGHTPESTTNHYEILLRHYDDEGNIQSPYQILNAAERYNIIQQIDEWVIYNCLTAMAAKPSFVDAVEMISINLSGQSLTSNHIALLIKQLLHELALPPHKLCFEITETTAISKLNDARTFIAELRELGCYFALDDFGTGLSSLSYLKHLPVDYLKIDGSFVKEIVSNPIDHAMVKAVNEMGHIVGMKTIAEFVEDSAIEAELETLNVDYVQGYGIAKPKPFSEILANFD